MASVSGAPAPGLRQVDLSKLSVQQLAQLKQQVDKEINVLHDSLQTMKMAQSKFAESEASLEKITPKSKGKTILVPLTSSMYVPGVLLDVDNVVIDIGTGYYVQKDINGGKDYFQRRVQFITEQMEKMQMVGREKANIQDTIISLLSMKLQANKAPAS